MPRRYSRPRRNENDDKGNGGRERNRVLLKTAYEKWIETRGGSVDHWVGLLADRVEWHSLADGGRGMEFTCCAHSPREVRAYFDALTKDWSMVSLTVNDFIADGDRVVALTHAVWRNDRTGKVLDTPKTDVWRLKDGQIVEFQEMYDTAEALAAAAP